MFEGEIYNNYKVKGKSYVNEKLELKDGTNHIKCHNCGASIDITEGHCSYCHSEIKYFQDWILQK